MCVRACVYAYVRVCVYVRVYACMCVNVFACVCVRVRPYLFVSPPSDLECALFTLPARLGRLGIRIPSETAASELNSSLLLSSSLKDDILDQDREYGHNIITDQLKNRATINSVRDADDLYRQLSDSMQRAVNLAKEKGASTWLTVLPLTDHGFALHKSAFHDSLALRYGWTPSKPSSKCDCGNSFTVEHALSCARGRIPTIRHNKIRDLTANLLTEVFNDDTIEPELQALTTEHLIGDTANSQDGERLDISTNGVWGGRSEKTYFDLRNFNPHAPSNKNMAPSAYYKKHE